MKPEKKANAKRCFSASRRRIKRRERRGAGVAKGQFKEFKIRGVKVGGRVK